MPDMKEKLEKIEESQTKKEFDAKNLLSINDALETKLSLYSNISSNRKDRGEKVNLLISLGQSGSYSPPKLGSNPFYSFQSSICIQKDER